MKKQLFVLVLAVGLAGCVSESRTVEREISEPAGSTTIIDADADMDRDTDVDVETDLDVPDVDVDADLDRPDVEVDAEVK